MPDIFTLLLESDDDQFAALAVRLLLVVARRLGLIDDIDLDRAVDALRDAGQGVDQNALAIDLTGRVLDRFVARYGQVVNESVYQSVSRRLLSSD